MYKRRFVPVMAGMAVCAAEVITVLYGEKWAPAVLPFAVLCIFGGLRALVAVCGYLLNGVGHPDKNFRMAMWRLAMIGLFIVPFTLSYGLVGAAVAVCIPMGFALLMSVDHVSRVLEQPQRVLYKVIAGPALKALVVAVVLGLLREHTAVEGVAGLAVLVGVGAVLYALMNGRMIVDVLRRRT
jgi:O-antigen/teichoic acid export membrane protein